MVTQSGRLAWVKDRARHLDMIIVRAILNRLNCGERLDASYQCERLAV